MISTKIKTKPTTKNIVLLALISTTLILSLVSYTTHPLPPQLQQVFGQGAFQAEDDDQSPSSSSQQLTIDEATNDTDQTDSTTITEDNQKIILDDITIPITSDTQLSLELPDSTITVEPNQ